MADKEYFLSDVPESCLPFSLQHTADMPRSGLDAALERGIMNVFFRRQRQRRNIIP